MKIMITGAAGFIGAACAAELRRRGHDISGIDNFNDYYSPAMKEARVKAHGLTDAVRRADICDAEALESLAAEFRPDKILHLAAQAGVRYSIENPRAYVRANIEGFINVAEVARKCGATHLIYASSSSVYGRNSSIPYTEADRTDAPASIYAATKKADELMASVYSGLYSLPTTGLRFFTVYGPWGRPDMAPMLFIDALMHERPIRLFNEGKMERDFTYIADVVEAVCAIVEGDAPESTAIYNVGRGCPTPLLEFIGELERQSGRRTHLVMEPMQPGDVVRTWADCSRLEADFGVKPFTSLGEGLREFCGWYKKTYTKILL